VLSRPDNAVAEDDNVCPGRYCFKSSDSDYDVTWWDPKILDLDVRQSFGIRQEELLAKGAADIAERDLEQYEHWRARLEGIRTLASKPTHIVQTATAKACTEDLVKGKLPQVDVVELPRGDERPAGVRFGTLVHAALATVGLDATAEQAANVAAFQGRILGATEQEVAIASHIVKTALSHPLLVRAKEAGLRGHCRREVPVTLTQQNGSVIEGVVDLAFLDEGLWTVVDFKTDRELANELEHYKKQVGLYCAAIATATGRPSCGILMHV
jgi:ATP-dependent helicase/nuclease subunit A